MQDDRRYENAAGATLGGFGFVPQGSSRGAATGPVQLGVKNFRESWANALAW